MAASGCVTFRSVVRGRMEVPVKGTFIHFDIPLLAPKALRRSSSCPPPLFLGQCADSAAGELCHAMVPRRLCNASASPSQSGSDIGPLQSQSPIPSGKSGTKGLAQGSLESREKSPDGGISEASTKESAGLLESQSPKEGLQKWTTIPSRKKKPLVNCSEPRVQREVRDQQDQRVSTPVAAQRWQMQSEQYGSGKGGSAAALAHRPAGGSGGKAGGKGKGLSHFERINVGIDDDESFRVVQRLIGPRGKHMQDITDQCRGSKVWIIGRGSRSWEDSLGPLMICVGATTRPVFDSAVTLIQELLERVREDHRA